jgi:hypothetical protein
VHLTGTVRGRSKIVCMHTRTGLNAYAYVYGYVCVDAYVLCMRMCMGIELCMGVEFCIWMGECIVPYTVHCPSLRCSSVVR